MKIQATHTQVVMGIGGLNLIVTDEDPEFPEYNKLADLHDHEGLLTLYFKYLRKEIDARADAIDTLVEILAGAREKNSGDLYGMNPSGVISTLARLADESELSLAMMLFGSAMRQLDRDKVAETETGEGEPKAKAVPTCACLRP